MAHVLVVDDRPANRELIAYLLEYFGHRVTQASGGRAALDDAHADHPDLVVMDLAMPGIDGYDAARMMRQDPELAGVPLVAVSSASSATKEAALDAGFDAFYPMPIDPHSFVELIEPLIPVKDG